MADDKRGEDEDEIDEDLDPRVKDELDSLNRATDEINRIETSLTELRHEFKTSLDYASKQLEKLAKKYGKNVSKAKVYYEASKEAKQANAALTRATQHLQRATGVHRAAKETIDLAEERLREFKDKKVDQAWQEVLNLQTNRFMEAEKDKFRSERIRDSALRKFEYLDGKCRKMQTKKKKSIKVAKPYYELKELLEYNLQQQKVKVDTMQAEAESAKRSYRAALSNLEKISSEIHEKRKQQAMANKRLASALSESDFNDEFAEMHNPAQLDINGPKDYDNIDELEEELESFKMDDEVDGGDRESDESDSDTKPSLMRSVSTPTVRPTLKKQQRLGSVRSREDEIPLNSKVVRRRKLKLDVDMDAIGENAISNSPVKELPNDDKTSSSMDKSTYEGLHGQSVGYTTNEKKRTSNLSDDFDIFDDLC